MDNDNNKNLHIEEQSENGNYKLFVDVSVLDDEPEEPVASEVPKLIHANELDLDIDTPDIPVHPLYTAGVNYGASPQPAPQPAPQTTTYKSDGTPTLTTQPVSIPPVYSGNVVTTGANYNVQQPNYKAPASSQPGYDTALASLIVGIVGIVFSIIPVISFVGGILGVVGIVLSISSKNKGFKGGMAIGGLVTSIVALVIIGLKIVSCMACMASFGPYMNGV